MAIQVICDKCNRVITDPHKLQVVDHGDIKKDWDLCAYCLNDVIKVIYNEIEKDHGRPEYPCKSCYGPEDRSTCYGCEKLLKWLKGDE